MSADERQQGQGEAHSPETPRWTLRRTDGVVLRQWPTDVQVGALVHEAQKEMAERRPDTQARLVTPEGSTVRTFRTRYTGTVQSRPAAPPGADDAQLPLQHEVWAARFLALPAVQRRTGLAEATDAGGRREVAALLAGWFACAFQAGIEPVRSQGKGGATGEGPPETAATTSLITTPPQPADPWASPEAATDGQRRACRHGTPRQTAGPQTGAGFAQAAGWRLPLDARTRLAGWFTAALDEGRRQMWQLCEADVSAPEHGAHDPCDDREAAFRIAREEPGPQSPDLTITLTLPGVGPLTVAGSARALARLLAHVEQGEARG